jgi:hypothetical protein
MACFSLDVAGVRVVEVTNHVPAIVLIAAVHITLGGLGVGGALSHVAGASWEYAAATDHALGFSL